MENLSISATALGDSALANRPSRIIGQSRMADRIRSHAWEQTILGPIASWPTELVVAVNLLLASRLVACILWSEEKLLIYNDLYQPLLGNKPSALGEQFLDVWDEIRDQANAIITPPLTMGESNIFEKVPFHILLHGQLVEKICTLTNSPIWIETTDGPQIQGLFQTIVDHTEGELAMRQLTASEAQLRQTHAELDAMYDTGAVACALIDPIDFRYVRVNTKLAEMLDSTVADVSGSSVFDLASNVPTLRLQLREVAKGTPLMNITAEGELANRPGEIRSWQSNYVPVRSTTGEITGIAAASIETTGQKKAEAILIRNEKLAAVGRLAASIAHEINNPLESVTNLIYLARGANDQRTAHEYLETADRELRRASAITNQTLRFYKQSTGAVSVTAHEMFESVLAIQQGRIVNAGIQVELRQRALQPVKCFDGEIRQVLNNIIGNAIDAMVPTGGRLLVRSRTATYWPSGTKGIQLTIADNGIGMSAEVIHRIFDAFYTTKGMNGNGLGLWVSKEIIDRHHGSLRARSSTATHAHGTVFTVFLPFQEADKQPTRWRESA